MIESDGTVYVAPEIQVRGSDPAWRCRKCCEWWGLPYRYPASPWVYCEECRRALGHEEQRIAMLRLEMEVRSDHAPADRTMLAPDSESVPCSRLGG